MKKLGLLLLLVLALFTSSAFARDLKEGTSGDDVKRWQSFLNTRNFDLPANGKFGPATKRATIIFQKKWDLYADGVVGPRTVEKARALGYGGSVAAKSSVKDPAIFPGEGMGKIILGESRASVAKKLGKPTESFAWEPRKSIYQVYQDTWVSNKSKSRLNVLFANGIVVQMETTSPTFLTPGGLSTKSSLPSLINFMGEDGKYVTLRSNRDESRRYVLIFDSTQGVAFFGSESSKDKSFEKVIVYPADTGVPPLYNGKFYSLVPKR